jgi:hypothetical protein
MELPSGERLAFSMLGNSHNLDSRGGEELLDRTARALFEWFARKKLK